MCLLLYLQKDYGANSNINYNNYVIAKSTNNEFNITDNTLVYVRKEAFNTEDALIAKNNGINPYYQSLYSDDIFNSKNSGEKYIGKKLIRFESDGEYNSKTRKYYFDHKNYADMCVIMPTPEQVKRKGKLNDLQQKIYSTALASERQALYKMMEPRI